MKRIRSRMESSEVKKKEKLSQLEMSENEKVLANEDKVNCPKIGKKRRRDGKFEIDEDFSQLKCSAPKNKNAAPIFSSYPSNRLNYTRAYGFQKKS